MCGSVKPASRVKPVADIKSLLAWNSRKKRSVAAGDRVQVQVTVRNSGRQAAEEVVQFYLNDLAASVPVPFHKLIGFQRVQLAPGENQTLSFEVTPEAMMLADESGQWLLEPGEFHLNVGGCSPGPRGLALGTPGLVSASFTVS
jgi:beta-glucosidase